MRFLILSDMHGNIDNLDKLDDEYKAADAVLCAGDFARFEQDSTEPPEESGMPVLSRLMKKHEKVFAVIGNCDSPDFRQVLEEQDVSVEASLVYDSSFFFCGSGGGMEFTGVTPNERTDDDLTSDLATARESAAHEGGQGEWNNLIIIAHHPPKDTKLDMINSGIHVGSPGIRQFIEEIQPLLVISGHIHESRAIDTLGLTTLVNPGPLAEGCYAVVEVSQKDGKNEVTLAELRKLT